MFLFVCIAASASTSEEVTQPPKKLRVTPVYMGVTQAPDTQTDVAQPSTLQRGVIEAPPRQTNLICHSITQAPETMDVCDK